MAEENKSIPSHIPETLREVFARSQHPFLMWDGIENIPAAIEEVLSTPSQNALRHAAEALQQSQELYMIGCGTSYFAAIAASYVFHSQARIPASPVQAFEYLAYPPPFSKGHGLIGISHTGTTPVVIDAVDRHNQLGGVTVGITDEPDSFLGHSAHAVISGKLGKEPALPKTRSYIATLMRLYLLAVELARLKNTLDDDLVQDLNRAPAFAQEVFRQTLDPVRQMTTSIHPQHRIVITAGGPNFATAVEGALKLVEAAQINAQAWEIEEAAHGTWASTNAGDWIILLAFQGPSLEKTKSIYQGLKVIGVKTWVITDSPEQFSDSEFITPIQTGLPEIFTPLLAVIPLYLFTYQVALDKGIHPDIMRLDDPRYYQARTGMRPTKKS